MRRILAISSVVLPAVLVGLSAVATAQTPVTVSVRLVEALSTGSSQVGDTFSGTLASPLVVGGHIVAKAGESVTGRVRNVVSSGRLKRPALITLSLDAVHAPSARYPMQTGDLTIKADSHAASNLVIIGGAAAAGAAMGGAAGGGKGAAIGAVAGAGAGTAGAYLTGKREIVLPAETLLTFHVSSVTISPKELTLLQPVMPGASSEPPVETQTVIVRGRHHHDGDEDDDDQGEDEHGGYYYQRPREIQVIFLADHHASVVIYWSSRIEHLTLRGDDVEDILEPLCEHTRLSAEIVRTEILVKSKD